MTIVIVFSGIISSLALLFTIESACVTQRHRSVSDPISVRFHYMIDSIVLDTDRWTPQLSTDLAEEETRSLPSIDPKAFCVMMRISTLRQRQESIFRIQDLSMEKFQRANSTGRNSRFHPFTQ